ncbi:MAG: class I SAM-dependent RNA methyltransferase [Candidatus Gracilibacteria bacterium]|nr:class I SAM-dependent RNA methyltransferase [Candidatus Gracilibacteria bacterium]
MKIVVTCIAGVESLLKKELEKLGFQNIEVLDRILSFVGDESAVARVNMTSRVANKVYVELFGGKIYDFDSLFNCLSDIDWKYLIGNNNPLIIKATSIKSELSSTPAIQKVSTKAILTKLTGSKDKFYVENNELPPIEIFLFLKDDNLRVLLNTSGEALHKRGYRTSSHEAPIKESLAASLVLLSNWNFSNNLYDFFCGSGTIVIEAAMIAKNIAPGLIGRKYAFENFSWYPKKHLEDARNEAKEKIFSGKEYNIFASDISEEYIEDAKINAKNAGVEDMIKFEVKPLNAYVGAKNLSGTVVSNPPYGLRMNQKDLIFVYKDIAKIFDNNENLNGGLITSFMEFDDLVDLRNWKKRKLYNGSELCYFYKRNK